MRSLARLTLPAGLAKTVDLGRPEVTIRAFDLGDGINDVNVLRAPDCREAPILRSDRPCEYIEATAARGLGSQRHSAKPATRPGGGNMGLDDDRA
jgi:hypothetical protein